jgi:dATP pyrophosphohydrolase
VRAPFQVLVIPFRRTPAGDHQVALFLRRDARYWQAIAGGGEDGETPLAAARREAAEEAGIPPGRRFYALHAMASIPADDVAPPGTWPPHVLAIPEHTVAVDAGDHAIALSHEHVRFAWLSVATALIVVRWPSNRRAIAELDARLRCGALVDTPDEPAAPVKLAPAPRCAGRGRRRRPA